MFGVHYIQFFKTEQPPKNGSAASDISFATVKTIEDIPAALRTKAWDEKVFVERLAAGHYAVVGYWQETPAHISWLADDYLRIDEIGFEWRMPEGVGCIYDCRTLPAFRGKGIYPAALMYVCERTLGQQHRQVWIYCEKGNKSSLRGIQKAGFEYAGSVKSLTFRYKLVWRSDRKLKFLKS
ncbi:MAG: hypothetical protein CL946_09570 [Ectothiorhodospiraceae bacterium]|nr:hypothetical protein [Ectothiorhodospiraceae bacterium]